ncbi:MAG: hypothetical protein CME19_22850 [Gemmatimonadetes bacterium]|nr:hypothetical protein [Gemmatimonadota bacterium]
MPTTLQSWLAGLTRSGLTRRQIGLVFGLYLALSIAYTFPLALNLSTHLPDKHPTLDLTSDAALQSWYPWWIRYALFSPDESVLHSDWVYYPLGMEMTMQPAMFLHGVMTIPLFWMDIVAANNTVIILSFALSGLAAFFLGYYVTRSVPAALFCGFVYGFCPYKFQHLQGHIQLMSTETLPLVALSLIRLFDKPERRNLVWAGIWLGLTAYTDYYYFAYSLLMVGFITTYRLITDASRLTHLRNVALAGVLAFAFAAPLIVPALHSATQSDYAIVTANHEKHKADLLSPFLPSQRQWVSHPIRGLLDAFTNVDKVDGIEHAIYIGWPLIILCVWFGRRALSRHGLMFAALSASFLILTLGGYLQVNGVEAYGPLEWKIPLPGLLLQHLPVFEGARAPSRIYIIAVIGLSVWGAIGLQRILKSDRILKGTHVATVLVAVTMLEYVMPPGMSRIDEPGWVEVVARDRKPGLLARIPLFPSRPPFWQPRTERKELVATLGRTDPDLPPYYWRHDALRFLKMSQHLSSIPTETDGGYLVNLLGIRYAVVDLTQFKEPTQKRIAQVLQDSYGMVEVYRDDTSALFRYPKDFTPVEDLSFRTADRMAEFHLALGWSNRKEHKEEIVAWMTRKRSVLTIPAVKAGTFELNAEVVLEGEAPTRLVTRLNGSEFGNFTLRRGTNHISRRILPGQLKSDAINLVEFEVDRAVGFPHHIGTTAGPGEIPIEVISGGFFTEGGGRAVLRIGGKLFTGHRGLLVGVTDTTGQVDVLTFKSNQEEDTGARLETLIREAPASATIVIAARTLNQLNGVALGQSLRWLGFPADTKMNPLSSLAIIGWKDGTAPILDYGASWAMVGTAGARKLCDASVGLKAIEFVRQ